MTDFRSAAWLLLGISSVPGELALRNGILSFEATDTGTAWPSQLRKLCRRLGRPELAEDLLAGRRLRLLEWPLEEIQASFPWHYFSGGIKIRHGAIRLRFSFGAQASTGNDLAGAAENLQSIKSMRSLGKRWKTALEASPRRRNAP